MQKNRYVVLVLAVLMMSLTVFAEDNVIHAEPDQPGIGTGPHVLDRGFIQWETGVEIGHLPGMHVLTLPSSLFRFGLSPWAELRLEYNGSLLLDDQPLNDSMPDAIYEPSPLWIGSKIKLWGGSDEPRLRWIPRTSLLLNLGLPLTKIMADNIPVSGKIDLLFENDLCDWLTMGYDVGVYWLEWAPVPDIFAALNFNFEINEQWSVYVESYNQFDPDAMDMNNLGKTYTMCDINLDFGFTYAPHPRAELDAYAGFNLYHSESEFSTPRNNSYVGLGVTWLIHAQ